MCLCAQQREIHFDMQSAYLPLCLHRLQAPKKKILETRTKLSSTS